MAIGPAPRSVIQPRRVRQLPGNAPVERFAAERAEPRIALESVRGREGLSFRRVSRRTRIQPSGLVWEGLEGATRPSMSMRHASREFAIG